MSSRPQLNTWEGIRKLKLFRRSLPRFGPSETDYYLISTTTHPRAPNSSYNRPYFLDFKSLIQKMYFILKTQKDILLCSNTTNNPFKWFFTKLFFTNRSALQWRFSYFFGLGAGTAGGACTGGSTPAPFVGLPPFFPGVFGGMLTCWRRTIQW